MITETLPYLSIALEALVVVLGILIATQNKKNYGWGIALTFAIYIFYDSVRAAQIAVSETVLYSILAIASFSTLWAVYKIYRGK